MLLLKPPRQDSLADYLVLQALLHTLSIWPWNPNVPREAELSAWLREVFTAVIEEGDSENNTFSLSFYLAAIISNLGALQKRCGIQMRQSKEYHRAVASIDRAMALDKVLPSYGNLVTLSGIQAKFSLALTDKQVLPAHMPFFLSYTRIGNLPAVRRLAMDCVWACQLPSPWLYKYARQLLRKEQSLSFRRHVAEGVVNSWMLALALGEIDGIHVPQHHYNESPEERRIRETDEMERDVPAWRKALTRYPEASRLVMSQLIDANVDSALRMSFLQAAELYTPGRREGAAARLILKIGSGTVKSKPKVNAKNAPGAIIAQPTAPPQKKKPKGKQYRNGLSEEDFKAVNITLEKLLVHPRSDFFRDPVPDDDHFAPGYYKLIKTPIDLSAIKRKLMDGQYQNRHQFREDLELIVSNCRFYNDEQSVVYGASIEFEKLFKTQWARVEKTLTKKAQAEQAAPQGETTLHLNVKPIVESVPAQPAAAEPMVPVVRVKDHAQPAVNSKQKTGPKLTIKKASRTDGEDVNTDIMDALGDTTPLKPKKIKISTQLANGQSSAPTPTPKLKISKPVNHSASKTETPPSSSLKRKLESSSTKADISTRETPKAASPPLPPPKLDNSHAPPENVKRLTQKGLTADRTPFKKVRALKWLRELSTQFRVLVSSCHFLISR